MPAPEGPCEYITARTAPTALIDRAREIQVSRIVFKEVDPWQGLDVVIRQAYPRQEESFSPIGVVPDTLRRAGLDSPWLRWSTLCYFNSMTSSNGGGRQGTITCGSNFCFPNQRRPARDHSVTLPHPELQQFRK
jgi:hypothetical protein